MNKEIFDFKASRFIELKKEKYTINRA